MKKSVYIGFDSPHPQPFAVAARSVHRSMGHTRKFRSIHGLRLLNLIDKGLYRRPIGSRDNGQLVDLISNAPMATEFALSRFLVPHLAGNKGLALFMDCDMLVRGNLMDVFALAKADPSKAVWVVKHQLAPVREAEQTISKMDGREQT